MKAEISYKIHKTTLLADPESGWRWILVRGASAQAGGHAVGVVPDVDAAVFTSEGEAALFSAYLTELQKR